MDKGEAYVNNNNNNNDDDEDFINNYDNENNNNNNNNNNDDDDDENNNNNDNNDNKDRKKLRIKLLKLSSNQSTESTLGYNETLMHGHYANLKLRTLLKHESEKWKRESRSKESLTRKESRLKIVRRACSQLLTGRSLQDWIFLTFLGIAVAIFSFLIDLFTEKSLFAHRGLYGLLSGSVFGKFMAWVTYPLVFVAFSVGFTRLVGPTAIGSGIPEVKTIMKGVVLKEYLTFKTLVAKVIGLSTSLGSGLPLGKVGPFVHVASVTASNLSKLFPAFRHVKENEALQMDILTAASAVGVSCTFAAPIGGVLFSVEATSTYFAVRNYWRGFYSAMCGAFTFRLLSSITKSEETLTALFKTELRQALPYDIFEILAFAFVGLVCGILGAGFVWLHKNIVLFVRGQKWLNNLLKKSPVIYPCIITMLIFSITFPEGAGKYMAGQLTLREAINQMFDNRTWMTVEAETEDEERMLAVWKGPLDNVLLTIGLFFAMKFWMCAISTTLPFPCGIFIPAFALGSSVGRFMGEVMAHLCPEGIRGKMIVPGAYSLVGAATFSGAVTHTVSPAVIVFELTGHLGHLLPCMIAVMVAGAVANFLQPSVYDAMIEIKKLPFLQSTIDSQVCNAHNITAEDIMVREVECIPEETTFGEVWRIITQCRHRAYPVVTSKDNPKLIGSVLRADLKYLLLSYLNCQSLVTPSPPPPSSSSLSTSEKIHPLMEQDEEKEATISDKLLDQSVDIFTCDIDHAPFQIPSRTSLYRIHWLFSLLALHHAFVTEDGKIVGVLSLAEVRRAIQNEVNTCTKK